MRAMKVEKWIQTININGSQSWHHLYDLYCIKPLDLTTLSEAARQTRAIITVEDHFADVLNPNYAEKEVCRYEADR